MFDKYDLLLYKAPHLDVHGFDRTGAIAVVEDFINENYKNGNEVFVIIHGSYYGVLRKSIHEYLKRNNKVVSFHTLNDNSGATKVILKEK